MDETARLDAVRALGLLDAPRSERYERIARMARRLFGVPIAAVNLVDDERQFTLAGYGLPSRNTPAPDAFCAHTIRREETMVVTDTSSDDRFRNNPLVLGEPHIRFYAGVPVHDGGGHPVGALCIIDDQPRELSEQERLMLRELAAWVDRELATEKSMLDARDVQQGLFPGPLAVPAGYRLAGRCEPAADVGGDFFDWALGDAGDLHLAVGDVMGKGLGAALLAAEVRSVVSAAAGVHDLEAAFSQAAHAVQADLEATSSFVTMLMVRVTPATGEVRFLDAGHGLGVVFGASGPGRPLRTEDPPVGLWPERSRDAGSEAIGPGESLLIVSDGVLEGFPAEDEDDPLGPLVRACREHRDPADAVEALVESAAAAGHRRDDATVVLLSREA
ncbi:PP2C family protein-serine/threonine phosphatase [Nocardioides donggukensis]|uniref:SpoIIE family protein phosphatase n=1 Tax=Nocardioides donggukensis TaxID=2774019 RepID=A0A927K315_9ACTN|nr:GAF domain-containing SpoIIE family protein phosphatase [Nocardioides donggukensis]MBD8869652.1 SpoIIE family protein phosphatase [Nocardioides donggukensis]